jgi:hypothetical protein
MRNQEERPMIGRILAGGVLAMTLAACGGPGGTGVAAAAAQSGPDAWPAKWCEAVPGTTKAELIAIMGPPTGSSDTTLTWAARQYQFNAFLGGDGRIRQLDINTYALSPAEQAALKCEKVRTVGSMARAAARKAMKPRRTTFPPACTLVTGAEMSAILGAAVTAEGIDRPNVKTECNYKPATGISPAIKLSIDWGDGRVAMGAVGAMSAHEPGLTSPYDGIGDQAAVVGPALMIRSGDDLVTIVFTGVSGAPAKAKRIFETAKPRM